MYRPVQESCAARETARCRCKLRYVVKFTATSHGSSCNSTAVVIESDGKVWSVCIHKVNRILRFSDMVV